MIELRRADERFTTHAEGRTTYHSFSYGAHYDPANTGFGPLIALNDEQLPPGTGYDEHRHAGVVIVTWVLEGKLQHTDSLGNDELLPPGSLAVTDAGSGITHTEHADPVAGVRFLQSMVRGEGGDPWCRIGPEARVELPGATFEGRRVARDFELPDTPLVDLFVVSGHLVLGDRELGPGDEARLTDEASRHVVVEEPGEVGIWAFAAPTGG